jgi:hypothetical protein
MMISPFGRLPIPPVGRRKWRFVEKALALAEAAASVARRQGKESA